MLTSPNKTESISKQPSPETLKTHMADLAAGVAKA
jgi:hypothetical protein